MSNGMLSKYVTPGSKVEIRAIRRNKEIKGDKGEKVYQSQVYDIISEDRIEIVMPMEKTKLVLLPIGGEYDLFFYTESSIYQCRAKLMDRGKKKNTYLLVMDLISNLRKDQRREYYRFSCALEMSSGVLAEDEIADLKENMGKEELAALNIPLKRSVIVDISGGGLRFVANYKYDIDSVVLCKYRLDTAEGPKTYEIFGKVLSVKENEGRPGVFEHRIRYVNINTEEREEIIKFIFEKERKNLKKKDKE